MGAEWHADEPGTVWERLEPGDWMVGSLERSETHYTRLVAGGPFFV